MIKKPTNANTIPPNLNWASLTSFNFSNIFLIFEGNKAYKAPSINKNVQKRLLFLSYFYCVDCFAFISPKNLKNSLSGERIKEVSPPIKAFS